MMTHDEIVARCLEIDAMANDQVVHYMTAERRTFRLVRQSMYWCSLADNERYCMVKYGNYFLDKDEADAAVERALKK